MFFIQWINARDSNCRFLCKRNNGFEWICCKKDEARETIALFAFSSSISVFVSLSKKSKWSITAMKWEKKTRAIALKEMPIEQIRVYNKNPFHLHVELGKAFFFLLTNSIFFYLVTFDSFRNITINHSIEIENEINHSRRNHKIVKVNNQKRLAGNFN